MPARAHQKAVVEEGEGAVVGVEVEVGVQVVADQAQVEEGRWEGVAVAAVLQQQGALVEQQLPPLVVLPGEPGRQQPRQGRGEGSSEPRRSEEGAA